MYNNQLNYAIFDGLNQPWALKSLSIDECHHFAMMINFTTEATWWVCMIILLQKFQVPVIFLVFSYAGESNIYYYYYYAHQK